MCLSVSDTLHFSYIVTLQAIHQTVQIQNKHTTVNEFVAYIIVQQYTIQSKILNISHLSDYQLN